MECEGPTPCPAAPALLRKSVDVARRARKSGEHPFGCILLDATGAILMGQGNGYHSERRDMTAHAECLLASHASKQFTPSALASCTLYASAAEPCAMCSGALYWAGIGRLVYGQSEANLKAATGNHSENPTLDLPCRAVFAAGQRRVEVIGPMLEEEAELLQQEFWS
jgi:tRNA(Arg) A34 adenosine deaminase TadA